MIVEIKHLSEIVRVVLLPLRALFGKRKQQLSRRDPIESFQEI